MGRRERERERERDREREREREREIERETEREMARLGVEEFKDDFIPTARRKLQSDLAAQRQ